MKIGPGVSELWGVENRPLPLTRPMAYTTACTTVKAVMEWRLDEVKVSMVSEDLGAHCSTQLRCRMRGMLKVHAKPLKTHMKANISKSTAL